jgi:hypothetical protein
MNLRAEQWMENHPEAPAEARAAVKRRFRDAFYTDTPEWKARIVEQGLQAANRRWRVWPQPDPRRRRRHAAVQGVPMKR